MRELIKDFVRICAETLPLKEPIHEFGSLQVAGQEGSADLRPLFPGKEYVGSDMREGPGVDRILNLHNIALPSNSVGTTLVMDTLEHVEFPHHALEEIYRVTQPNGTAIISSVMRMRIHAYPNDYWRFTPEGFAVLLRPFADSFVSYGGDKKFPHTVIGIGFKGPRPSLEQFAAAWANWQVRWEAPDRESILGKWSRKLRKSYQKRCRSISGGL
jgi:ubiquinone/menaquinone biosynthesis C-methylase UbiE